MEDRYGIGVDSAEGKFRCWNRDDQERLLDELDPMSHEIWQKPMEGAMSFDVGEGKDKSIATLFEIGENGEYRPIGVCDSISFGGDVERSGYVGIEAGELSFSAEAVDVPNDDFLKGFMGIVCPKRFEDDFEEFANEVSRGLSRVMMGIDEEYTTPKCDLKVEATDKSVYYSNVSATFKRK